MQLCMIATGTRISYPLTLVIRTTQGGKSHMQILKYIAGLTLLASSWAVNASLITNGTFDTDLSGWDIDATTGVTPVTGEARIGQPGSPGYAIFSQTFDIAAGTTSLSIGFDYLWQINAPTTPDEFTVSLSYESNTGTQTISLLDEWSDSATFANERYDAVIAIDNLSVGLGNGMISFMLQENIDTSGTRVHLDNVAVSAVPVPAAIWLFGTALVGLVGFGKRKSKAAV